jgi:heme-degrading monooxygenase HmoA
MMVVIVEFELRAGAESEFEAMLKHMQQRVKQYDGYLGEAPCCSIENEKIFVTLFYWRDRKSLKAWREDPKHVKVQRLARKKYSPGTKLASVSLNVSMRENTRNNACPITMTSAPSRKSLSENR